MKSFSELTGKEKSVELLRWILVPAVAALVVVAPGIIARLLMPTPVVQLPGSPRPPVSDFNRFVLPWVYASVMGAAFVIAAAKTAPRWRCATAIVLAVLSILQSLQYYVLVHLPDGHYAYFAVAAASATGGAAYLVYSEKSKGSHPCPVPSPPS